MEGLKVTDANLVVYLHPSKAKKISDAIPSELSSLLFKYNETFDGVVLAYDLDIVDKLAKILPGIHPYFGVRLKSKLLLFNPKADMLLEGKVVKLSQQSIHAIVLGFSSAVIVEEDIRKDFKYKIKHGKKVYVSTVNKQHRIKVGTILRFVVKSFDEEILHISASLLPTTTGDSRWLCSNSEDCSLADSNTKKQRESEGRGAIVGLNKGMVNGEKMSLDTDQHAKKSKKRKNIES